MTNARPPMGTGAVEMPGSQHDYTAPRPQVAAELMPEFAYVGAVLLVDLPTSRAALARVRDDDVADRRLRLVLSVARRLVADGVQPDAVKVLVRARLDGDVVIPTAIGDLSMLLIDLVDRVPVPASWGYYAQAILDDALRRRVAEAGARLTQAAEGGSLDSLLELKDREDAAVRELVDRRAIALTPPLRAVP